MKTFSETIKEAREKKGMLVRELARELGIDQALISRFEKATRRPTRRQVAHLANVLGIDAVEKVQTENNKSVFHELMASAELESISRYLSVLKGK
ncbi:MAG TPA: helix-turn-helix transcriptional regulator [Chitinophagaceae bacterium]|nr:helix-turn-helix transcriptional regulator [Chitinophagaceae bacterium]